MGFSKVFISLSDDDNQLTIDGNMELLTQLLVTLKLVSKSNNILDETNKNKGDYKMEVRDD